jgi:hypothetical protein
MFAAILRLVRTGPVSLVRNERCGELRYSQGERHASAYYEISGVPEYDLLVWLEDMQTWSTGERITEQERADIRAAFEAWAVRSRKAVQW